MGVGYPSAMLTADGQASTLRQAQGRPFDFAQGRSLDKLRVDRTGKAGGSIWAGDYGPRLIVSRPSRFTPKQSMPKSTTPV
jgi:hypothetical protein